MIPGQPIQMVFTPFVFFWCKLNKVLNRIDLELTTRSSPCLPRYTITGNLKLTMMMVSSTSGDYGS